MVKSLHLISLQAAAEQLGVSVKTLRRWIAGGRITAYRTGPRLLRVDQAELEKLARAIPSRGAA